ncbi:BID domain-containing T4SS effector, partial [Agrobacterium pusense]|uniref:BID domain-containing T4SS effector n=1 Tax=Agrobacterium pusense TaxID=648995 RepID=UPI0032D9B0C0
DNERSLGARQTLGRGAGRPDVLVAGRDLPDLTEKEIADRLHGSARLADKRAEIENVSRLVFGNSQAVASSVVSIRDARSGAVAGDDVREGRLGEMAGEGKGWLRGPSPARQSAEAHAPQLAAALADYGHAVDFERHQIVTQHREVQARQRVEIPTPSAKLTELLRIDSRDQVRRLNSEPSLRRELETMTLAISRRLSPADKADLKGEMSPGSPLRSA